MGNRATSPTVPDGPPQDGAYHDPANYEHPPPPRNVRRRLTVNETTTPAAPELAQPPRECPQPVQNAEYLAHPAVPFPQQVGLHLLMQRWLVVFIGRGGRARKKRPHI